MALCKGWPGKPICSHAVLSDGMICASCDEARPIPIRVWFAIYEGGEHIVESDVYEVATEAEALAAAEEDYPGCNRYSTKRLSV